MATFVKPLVIDPITSRTRTIKPGETLNASVLEVDVIELSNGTAGPVPAGTPVIVSGSNALAVARANSIATADVQGIALENIAVGATGSIQTDGKVVLTTVQWDAITGQTGGLTPGSSYFLASVAEGKLTTNSPTGTGEVNTFIGRALNSTTLDLSIQLGIEL